VAKLKLFRAPRGGWGHRFSPIILCIYKGPTVYLVETIEVNAFIFTLRLHFQQYHLVDERLIGPWSSTTNNTVIILRRRVRHEPLNVVKFFCVIL